MAWTAAKTWVTTELLTASDFNAQFRDNPLHLYDLADERFDNTWTPGGSSLFATSFTAISTKSYTIPWAKAWISLHWGSRFSMLNFSAGEYPEFRFNVTAPSVANPTAFDTLDQSGTEQTDQWIGLAGGWLVTAGPVTFTVAFEYRVSLANSDAGVDSAPVLCRMTRVN